MCVKTHNTVMDTEEAYLRRGLLYLRLRYFFRAPRVLVRMPSGAGLRSPSMMMVAPPVGLRASAFSGGNAWSYAILCMVRK